MNENDKQKYKNAGALGKKYELPLNDEATKQCLKWIAAGLKLYPKTTVSNRILLGRCISKLKNQLGRHHLLKQVIERYWLDDGSKYEDHERIFQQAVQMYKFSKGKGRGLCTNMPMDSYTKIMTDVCKILGRKNQAAVVRKINSTRQYRGVDIEKTKELRKAIKEAIASPPAKDDPSAIDKDIRQKAKDKCTNVNKSVRCLKEAIEDLYQHMKKNTKTFTRNDKDIRKRLENIISSFVVEQEQAHIIFKKLRKRTKTIFPDDVK